MKALAFKRVIEPWFALSISTIPYTHKKQQKGDKLNEQNKSFHYLDMPPIHQRCNRTDYSLNSFTKDCMISDYLLLK
jgi:hypothetical protein